MHYELNGSGSPSLVLVHGFACDHTDWNAQVEALREHASRRNMRSARAWIDARQSAGLLNRNLWRRRRGTVEALQLTPAVLVGHRHGMPRRARSGTSAALGRRWSRAWELAEMMPI